MSTTPAQGLAQQLAAVVGAGHVSTDIDVLAAHSIDWTGRYRGTASALVRPGSTGEVAAVLRACRDAGAFVTVQGGRTSLVAGTVPEHDDVLLSTERLTELGAADVTERRIRAGAGVTLTALQQAATRAGLLFGVDLASRDSATVGGMAATNAGGLRTVRYGAMGQQVVGLEVVLPDGSVLQRHSVVCRDKTGYDLAALFVGAEGTLGVITSLDLRLNPVPPHRVTALCGFADLESLIAAARALREVESIAALELIPALPAACRSAERPPTAAPVQGDWLLLAELAGGTEQTTRLAEALDDVCREGGVTEPAVGVDAAARQRLWQVRESVADVVTAFGPPLKFDVALPLSAIAAFATDSAALLAQYAPEAVPVLFGHVGEGNLHLNVLRCDSERETAIYAAMMDLIAAHGGNVSSEHGIGSRKRNYLPMSRQPADIAAMRAIKTAFDPNGYLNPAVLFG